MLVNCNFLGHDATDVKKNKKPSELGWAAYIRRPASDFRDFSTWLQSRTCYNERCRCYIERHSQR